MAREPRFNPLTRGVFGVLAAFITLMLGIAIGQRMLGSNPFHVFHYVAWSLVVLAIVLDYLAVNLLVWQVKKLVRRQLQDWEDWIGFVIVGVVGVVMFIATMWTWSQHLLENFLRWASKSGIQWFDPGALTNVQSRVCGLMAFALVACLTNWIWHHPLWRGRARDAVPAARQELSRRQQRRAARGQNVYQAGPVG